MSQRARRTAAIGLALALLASVALTTTQAQANGLMCHGFAVTIDGTQITPPRAKGTSTDVPLVEDVSDHPHSYYGATRYIRGTSGRDVIRGTDGPDYIVGLAGDDIICGLRGDDVINAGTGHDTIRGGAGRDLIAGHFGYNHIFPGFGRDVIVTGQHERNEEEYIDRLAAGQLRVLNPSEAKADPDVSNPASRKKPRKFANFWWQ